MAEQAQNTPPLTVPHSSDDQEITELPISTSPSLASQPTNTQHTQVDIPDQELHDHDEAPVNEFLLRLRQLVYDGIPNIRAMFCILGLLFIFILVLSIFAQMLFSYLPLDLQMGPNSSYLINAEAIFVSSIEARQQGNKTVGPMLYGFHKNPSLDVEVTWSRKHHASVEGLSYMSWSYYLNVGSQINISYEMTSLTSAGLILVVAKGNNSLVEWMEDPMIVPTTQSWIAIYGKGSFVQDISHSDAYYVAVANLQRNTKRVDLNITIHSLLYNTSDADYKCSLIDQVCSFKQFLRHPNAAILTTPRVEQVTGDYKWYITVSFGAQYLTYIFCTSILIIYTCALCIPFMDIEGEPPLLGETEPQPLLQGRVRIYPGLLQRTIDGFIWLLRVPFGGVESFRQLPLDEALDQRMLPAG